MRHWIGLIGTIFWSINGLAAPTSRWLTDSLPGRTPPYVVVQAVTLSGNRLTKDYIVRRELDIRVGDSLAVVQLDERLAANARRVFNTQLFISADVVVDSLVGDRAWLRVRLKENWYLWAAPYARLNDRNLNEWIDRGRDLRRLNYGAFIDHENLFGRMQKLEVVGETGFTNRGTLRYNIPFLDRSGNNGLYAEAQYMTLANLAQNTVGNQLDFVYRDEVLKRQFDAHVRLRHRQGFYRFHYLEAAFNYTRISESLADFNPFYLAGKRRQQQYATLAYTFRYDHRDNVNFALKGRAFIADVRRLGMLPGDSFRSWQFRLTFADYYSLGKGWFANYIVKAKAFTNPDVPYELLRGIGYQEDILRGYDLYVVNGSVYGSGRVNLKRRLLQRTYTLGFIKWRQFNTLPLNLYLNAFTDGGYVDNRFSDRLDNPLANRWLRSYGLGLEVNTWYNSVVRFNLSRNSLNQTNFFVNLQKDLWTRWN